MKVVVAVDGTECSSYAVEYLARHPMVIAIVEDESTSAFHRPTGQMPTGGFKGS